MLRYGWDKALNGGAQLGVADDKMNGRGLALGHHDPPPLVDEDLQVAEGLAPAHLPAIVRVLRGKSLRLA